MRILLILLLILFAPKNLCAQVIDTQWSRFQNTDGSGGGFGKLPIILLDLMQNVVVCGDTYSPGTASGFITTKYDFEGTWLWERKHDGFTDDEIRSAAMNNEGNIYVGGNSRSPTTSLNDFIIFKYTPSGDTSWIFRYEQPGTPIITTLSKILILDNGNLILFGNYFINTSFEFGTLVLSLDPAANILWEERLPDCVGFGVTTLNDEVFTWGTSNASGENALISWILAPDGETISVNTSDPYDDVFQNEYLIDTEGSLYIGDQNGEYKVRKYNSFAKIEWNYAKPFIAGPSPGFVTARAQALQIDDEGNLYFSGFYYVDSITGRVQITTCLDENGTLKWQHNFILDIGYSISETSAGIYRNGQYAITGAYVTDETKNYYNYYVANYDKEGPIGGGLSTLEGKRNYGTNINTDTAYVFVSGISFDTISANPTKEFVCKHKTPKVSAIEDADHAYPLLIYPNPTINSAQIKLEYSGKEKDCIADIIDASGRTILSQVISLKNGETQIDLRGLSLLSPGIYTVLINSGAVIYTGKLMKIK
jgi:hypothetical protein